MCNDVCIYINMSFISTHFSWKWFFRGPNAFPWVALIFNEYNSLYLVHTLINRECYPIKSWQFVEGNNLTLHGLNFLNGTIQLPLLDLSIIIFRDIKMRTWSWSDSSIEPDQTALFSKTYNRYLLCSCSLYYYSISKKKKDFTSFSFLRGLFY